MKGIVMRSTGSFYDVLATDGKKYNCRVRGKIRLEGIKETNPVAVGDYVSIDLEHEIGSITEILPRKNHILRQSVKKTGHAHVLAANIDQAMVVATLSYPRTSLGFIDRFLVSVEAFRIPQVIIFNKKDLLDEKGMQWLNELIALYTGIGVRCFSISALEEDQLVIRGVLQDKTTLVAGHSGVGKSTLLNKISPAIRQSVGEISDFSEKGIHTTTFAEMFRLDETTFVIDTPGIKEWGLVDMNQQEISDYFPEMRERRLGCKFQSRCIHVNEPKCAILDAVKSGAIALSRYESYLSMVLGEDNRK
ncbi:MAG: ribosome small subunit-dependent GTPase A [Cyclobacteriaceae bacterium]|jgi:ribosome biogenesis GTPase|nr:ribosome small subunit-dependent GTPase A [Cyclobacteriaceae bacterium]MDH4297889.1 ribosome small subunit-dependent GTPase A [Cyclobacteriaceae bacterium]MDH5249774.1 ribosome small subunit-dependent GTPase A [Cyclobacteriaceae bacterium]